MATCDIRLSNGKYCENEMTHFGRWIGYCDKHIKEGQEQDHHKTYENEIAPSLESGDMPDMEALDMMI